MNSRTVEQRTSRGSKTLKPVPRRIASARKRDDAGNGKRVEAPERVYGSLERESPEGGSLGVPAGRNKLARHRGEQTAGRLGKPEGGRRRRVGTRRDGVPGVLKARKGNEPHGRSCHSLRRGRQRAGSVILWRRTGAHGRMNRGRKVAATAMSRRLQAPQGKPGRREEEHRSQ